MSNQQQLSGADLPEPNPDEDYWPTPRWAVEALLPHLPMRFNEPDPTPWNIVDPGCGKGELVRYAHEAGLKINKAHGFELHKGRTAIAQEKWGALPFETKVYNGNFLDPGWSWGEDDPCRLVLMNSPYSKPYKKIGRDFVLRALEIAQPNGVVAALLPLAFCETPARKELIHDKHKSQIRVFGKRPGFGGEHSTGKLAYAWFIWDLLAPKDDWMAI